MAIVAPKENSDILHAEWIDEDYVNLSGLSVQQNDGNDESDTNPIISGGFGSVALIFKI